MSKKHKEAIQKQFTKTAEAFSVFAMRDTPEVLKEKIDFARPQAADVALDIACGPGAYVLALAPLVSKSRGIDLTPEMLRRARTFQSEKQIANADFVRGEAESLPFADGSFSLVSCQCAFHHMAKPKVILDEMVRVLNSGGRLYLTDPVAPESDSKFETYNRIEILRDPSHTETLRLTEYLRLFDEAGLEITRQSLRRRQRSFDNWMLRGGHAPGSKKYAETRKLMESSMNGDKSGFSAQPDGSDIKIVHNEAMFLLTRKSADGEEV
jgi:ubiquinone/menaquinone biosynthesis C-methylase UbiE